MILILSFFAFDASCLGENEKPEKNLEISIRLMVPDAGWSVSIEKVCKVGEELWAVSQLHRSEGVAAQIISTIHAKQKIRAPELPIRHFVIGKTWKWKNKEGYTFIKDQKEIKEQLKSAILIWKR